MAKKVEKKKPAVKAKKPVVKAAKPVKKAAPKPAPKKLAAAPKSAAKKVVVKKAAAPVAKPAAGKKPVVAATPKVDPKAAKAALKKGAPEKAANGKAKASPIPEKVAKKGKQAPVEEVVEATAEVTEPEASDEVVLTDAEGRRYCRVKDCDQLASVDGYCRYHYLLFWKKIQVRKKILSEGKLERYVEELTSRYPDKFLEMLRKDLRSEKEFLAAIQELEIDESASDNEFEEETQTYIEEVRGMAEPGAREEEDF